VRAVFVNLESEKQETVDKAIEKAFSGDVRLGLKTLGKTLECVCMCVGVHPCVCVCVCHVFHVYIYLTSYAYIITNEMDVW
jgi:hypothetical protein